MQEWEEKIYIREEGRSEGEKNVLKRMIAKKLEKGNDARQIAEELEIELPAIEALISELLVER